MLALNYIREFLFTFLESLLIDLKLSSRTQVTKFFFWALLDGAELTTSEYAVPDATDIVTSFQSAGFTDAEVYTGSTYKDVTESFGVYLETDTVNEADWDTFKGILETWWQSNYDSKLLGYEQSGTRHKC